MKTNTNTKISNLIPSRRIQGLAEKVGPTAKSMRALPDVSDMKPEDILSLFHEGKLNQKDTMFWLGVLAVNAEEKAKNRNSTIIENEDMISAFIEGTPEAFQADMREGLKKHGFSYEP